MVWDWLWLEKVLAPLAHPTRGKLHCWFCLKLLKFVDLCYDGLLEIFLTLMPVNIQLQILPTLALINIM